MEKYYYIAAGIAALGAGAPFLVLLIGDLRDRWREQRE